MRTVCCVCVYVGVCARAPSIMDLLNRAHLGQVSDDLLKTKGAAHSRWRLCVACVCMCAQVFVYVCVRACVRCKWVCAWTAVDAAPA